MKMAAPAAAILRQNKRGDAAGAAPWKIGWLA
jgi:hypothetical protein